MARNAASGDDPILISMQAGMSDERPIPALQ